MALLLVLGSLVLLGALLLAFLGGVKGDLKTSKIYADGSSVRTLADSTVNLVMAQINQATANPSETWASQPGMIRTYGDGNSAANYKLYSWDKLKTTGTIFDPASAGEAVPDQWYENKALFVDLNSPVVVGSATNFPILDPPPLTAGTTYYVEGFNVVDAPKKVNKETETEILNPVPMPVKWLYVLQNGEIVAPEASGTRMVSFNGTLRPTSSNPIVGRIAFWTDDETCKVNLNTASEGSFWSTPRTLGAYDWDRLAQRQPVQHEYQRYPGHPATVSLSSVFGSLFPVDSGVDAPNYSQYEPYYQFAPKLNKPNTPGSKAGTVLYNTTGLTKIESKDDRLFASTDEFQFQSYLETTEDFSGSRARVTSDAKEISAELMQKAKFFVTTNNRSPDVNLFNKPRIVTWPVHTGTTAENRTVFDRAIAFCGTINDNIYYFQRQRPDLQDNDLPKASSSSPSLWRNRQLIDYLRGLTNLPVPGFGPSTFQQKFGADRDQVLTEIFDYIRCLNLQDTTNGTTQKFAPPLRDSIGNTSMTYPGTWCGQAQVVPTYDEETDTRGFGRFPTISEATLLFVAVGWNNGTPDGANAVADGDINNHWTTDVDDRATAKANFSYPWGFKSTGSNFMGTWTDSAITNHRIADRTIAVQAMLLLSFFDPSEGYGKARGLYQVRVRNLDQFQWGGGGGVPVMQGMGFPAAGISSIPTWDGQYAKLADGGNIGFRFMFVGRTLGQNSNFKAEYPFYSRVINFPYTPPSDVPSFQFRGGNIEVDIIAPAAGDTLSTDPLAGRVVQTIELNFPSGNFPVPTYPSPGIREGSPDSQDRGNLRTRVASSNNTADFTAGTRFIAATDTVRSVRAKADLRVIAGRKNIRATDGLFDVFPEYSNSDEHHAHSLTETGGLPFYGAILGQLVRDVRFKSFDYDHRHLTVNSGSVGLREVYNAGNNANLSAGSGPVTGGGVTIGTVGNPGILPGDWDNGTAYLIDGPYINKADEGSLTSSGGVPYFVEPSRQWTTVGEAFFSPNRMMPSPVMFGSLPTGVKRGISYQTLLFCPNPAAGIDHPGFATPPDYLLLDLFHMPVIEPYPISEPLSTDGRINMNYQIVPFTYIERSTGIRAVFKSQRMLTIPDSVADLYKKRSAAEGLQRQTFSVWVPLDVDKTLLGFKKRFNEGGIFRSASEICSLYLYPARKARTTDSFALPEYDDEGTSIRNFWANHRVTGDNSRERPYAEIYPRLTTKSNTFMVHLWVQKLQKTPTTAPDTWVEGRDKILSEYRGSSVIERYIDPNDKRLPDFATETDATVNQYYKFRTLRTSQFAP